LSPRIAVAYVRTDMCASGPDALPNKALQLTARRLGQLAASHGRRPAGPSLVARPAAGRGIVGSRAGGS
jgi:hypothetical protein